MVDCVECGVQIIKLSVAYKKLVECGVQLITSMYKLRSPILRIQSLGTGPKLYNNKFRSP